LRLLAAFPTIAQRRLHRAGAVEEVARIVARIRRKWRKVRIVLRADSGFANEELMAWCEANRVGYVFGLAA
jgi:hypothetical protein